MQFLSVDNKIAFHLQDIPVSESQVLQTLLRLGFNPVLPNPTQLTQLAKTFIGTPYKYSTTLSAAPHIFNCTTLTRYAFRQLGIWLPVYAFEQKEQGVVVVQNDIRPGDLVFRTGLSSSRWRETPEEAIGHVGIVLGSDSILHASFKHKSVCVDTLQSFTGKQRFQGAVRILTPDLVVLTIPDNVEVERSGDVAVLLQKYF